MIQCWKVTLLKYCNGHFSLSISCSLIYLYSPTIQSPYIHSCGRCVSALAQFFSLYFFPFWKMKNAEEAVNRCYQLVTLDIQTGITEESLKC